jgi:hypothetical protein
MEISQGNRGDLNPGLDLMLTQKINNEERDNWRCHEQE